jgi:hypothetical protein
VFLGQMRPGAWCTSPVRPLRFVCSGLEIIYPAAKMGKLRSNETLDTRAKS